MHYWLVKSEPSTYAWSHLVKDGRTAWTGVRNFQARINLRAMRKGDVVFYYHSGEAKEVVGLARVVKEAYADPTAKAGEWSCVDLSPVKPLPVPVTLVTIKGDAVLREMALVRNSRLSVSPVTVVQAETLLALSG